MSQTKRTVINGDCLQVMQTFEDRSIDLILCDPPYGTTGCHWDSVINFEAMWTQIKRIVKLKSAVVLFGSQPFTSALIMSNPVDFKYQWTWNKAQISNPQLAKIQPLRHLEDICVFSLESPVYYPQGLSEKLTNTAKIRATTKGLSNGNFQTDRLSHIQRSDDYKQSFTNYPKQLLHFPINRLNILHPTQKPVELLRYLIRTYTKENETVLDFTAGSFSTGVACQMENRNFIGIEIDEDYCQIGEARIKAVAEQSDSVKENKSNATLPLFS